MTFTPLPDEHLPARSAGARISAFIRSFTKVVFVAMGMAVVGLLMKFAAVEGGNYVFVFAMAVLVLLFLVQIGLSFFYVIANVRLALLGSICSVALVMGFLALIFRYQNWFGWQITFFIALPVFLVTAYFLVKYFRKRHTLQSQHRHFLYQNLIFPYLFIFILTLIAAFAPDPEMPRQLQHTPADQKPDTNGMWRAMPPTE